MPDQLIAQQVGKKIKLVWTYAPAPSWPDANGFIYNEGEFEDYWVEGYDSGHDNYISKETDHLFLVPEYPPEVGFESEVAFVTAQKIDLTEWDRVSFYYSNDRYEYDLSGAIVGDLIGEYYVRIHARARYPHQMIGRTIEIYIVVDSNPMGSMADDYVARGVAVATSTAHSEAKIHEIWLEKDV